MAAIAFKQEGQIDTERFRLSESEFTDGRALLQDAILAGAPAPTPLISRVQSFLRLPAIALGLVLSTGFAVAANNTLPGDPLYPIKISVLEPIIGALQPTSSLRASWSVEVLHRRLWEVDELNTYPDADEERFEAAEELIRAQTRQVLVETEALPQGTGEEFRLKARQAIHQRSESLRRLLDVEKMPAQTGDNSASHRQNLLTTLEVNEQSLLGASSSSSRQGDEEKADGFNVKVERQPIPGPTNDPVEGASASEVRISVPGSVKIIITADESSSSVSISSSSATSVSSSTTSSSVSSSSQAAAASASAGGSVQIPVELPSNLPSPL